MTTNYLNVEHFYLPLKLNLKQMDESCKIPDNLIDTIKKHVWLSNNTEYNKPFCWNSITNLFKSKNKMENLKMSDSILPIVGNNGNISGTKSATNMPPSGWPYFIRKRLWELLWEIIKKYLAGLIAEALLQVDFWEMDHFTE